MKFEQIIERTRDTRFLKNIWSCVEDEDNDSRRSMAKQGDQERKRNTIYMFKRQLGTVLLVAISAHNFN